MRSANIIMWTHLEGVVFAHFNTSARESIILHYWKQNCPLVLGPLQHLLRASVWNDIETISLLVFPVAILKMCANAPSCYQSTCCFHLYIRIQFPRHAVVHDLVSLYHSNTSWNHICIVNWCTPNEMCLSVRPGDKYDGLANQAYAMLNQCFTSN